MRMNRLPGYGLPELAFWPQPKYERNKWSMFCLKLRNDGTLAWYRRYVDRGMPNHAVDDDYDNYPEARKAALELNKNVSFDIEKLPLSMFQKKSLRLKVDKALKAKSRLMDEEYIMLNEAIKAHANDPRVTLNELIINPDYETLRQPLFDVLSEMPYLHFVFLPKFQVSLQLVAPNTWECSYNNKAKTAKLCYQERIARGFGLSGAAHWGKTKATIRSMLLPRANRLLQLASVKRMLDEALRNGQKVLVVGNFVFWFEDKNQVGWSVKVASESETTSRGNTLWKEGTIISKNHGRIVVLPYTKENGKHVKGYTKNAPNDGNAIPRHKDEYVELPFEILDGDLMFSLFGELNYE
ncbi:TPA: hypothetical protein QIC17_004398 [Escherichia coli]|uniref:hypothetical protein n=1 Tax=Escherichia coli TaxID=562 RepID=UPI000DE31635|nr:hypothetical protein [Escherichia coli]EFD9355717.1 hypothetical protein [Escherichia coli]EHS9979972.1 hypothetical protein [Escherichia coli]EJT9013469.1 hypothetical protein [Escherichia coli]CAD5627115.1 Uncharacterised protein [Escherichia coli]HCO1612206.1 hypothetical protein [Escherichia coli]